MGALPARGPAPARPDRRARDPDLRALRRRGPAPRVLPGRARLLRPPGLLARWRRSTRASRARTASSTSCARSPTSSRSARGPDRYRRAFEALRRLLPVEAMAFVEWVEDTGEDMEIHLEGSATVGRGRDPGMDPRAAASTRPSTRRPRSVWARTGEQREIRLSPATRHQLIARLSTYELNTGLLVLESSFSALQSPAGRRSPSRRWRGRSRSCCRTARSARRSRSSPVRNRERAETLSPDPRDLQRGQEAPEPRRALPVDRHGRGPQPRLRRRAPLALRRGEGPLRPPRAVRPRPALGGDPGTGGPRRRDHAPLDRPQPGLQVLLRARPDAPTSSAATTS